MERIKPLSLPLLLLLSLLTCSCTQILEGKKAAEQGVTTFHNLYNENKADEIHSSSNKKFQESTSQEKFQKTVTALNSRLGKVTATTQVGFNVNINKSTLIVLTQNTTFERGTATETFTFEVQDGKASLLSYSILGDDLLP